MNVTLTAENQQKTPFINQEALTKNLPLDFKLPLLDEGTLDLTAKDIKELKFDKNDSLQLLAAQIAGRIDAFQFATGIFFDEAQVDYGKEKTAVIPIHGNTHRLKSAFGLDTFYSLLDPPEIERFLSEIKTLPNSEQIGILIDVPFWPHDLFKGIRIFNQNVLPIRIFYEKGDPKLFMPSFSIFHLYNRIVFGDNAVEPYPVVGAITGKQIQEDIVEKHVVGLNLPGTQVLEYADGLHMGRLGFSIHDMYHVLRLGFIPRNHRAAFQRINQVVEDTLQDWEVFSTAKKRGYFMIFRDQDFTSYQTLWLIEKFILSKKELTTKERRQAQFGLHSRPYSNQNFELFISTKRIKPFSDDQKKYYLMDAFSKELLSFLHYFKRDFSEQLYGQVAMAVFSELGSWKGQFDIDMNAFNWNLKEANSECEESCEYFDSQMMKNCKQLYYNNIS